MKRVEQMYTYVYRFIWFETACCAWDNRWSCARAIGTLAVNPNQFHCLHAVRVEIVTTFQKHAITREQEHTCNLFNILLHMFLYIYFAQNSLLLSVNFLFVSCIVESLNICVHKILLKLSRKMIQSNYLVTKIIIASRIKMLRYRGKNTDSLSKKRMFRYSICKPAT